MREVALLALLKGIAYTAETFEVQEEQVKLWIEQLDQDPFFKALRNIVWESLELYGTSATAKVFCLSSQTLEKFKQYHS